MQIAIRYLRPPTPPPPGDLIIVEEAQRAPPPPPPPLFIRQQPARAITPPPLVIRERPPPPPPPPARRQVIRIASSKRAPPPPPRVLIVERFAPLPAKPQPVIIERWLPYATPKRRVIYQRAVAPASKHPNRSKHANKNVIIEWQAPRVNVQRHVSDLGVVRADPADYVARFGSTLTEASAMPEFVHDIDPPSGLTLAASSKHKSTKKAKSATTTTTTTTSNKKRSSNSKKAAHRKKQPEYELEGDLYALKLIDLEREGLAHYKDQLDKAQNNKNNNNNNNNNNDRTLDDADADVERKNEVDGEEEEEEEELIDEIFRLLDTNERGVITRRDTERLCLRLNSRLRRSYGEDEVVEFFTRLDANGDGLVHPDEFKRTFRSFLSPANAMLFTHIAPLSSSSQKCACKHKSK